MADATGVSEGTARTLLARLAARGHLVRLERGLYGAVSGPGAGTGPVAEVLTDEPASVVDIAARAGVPVAQCRLALRRLASFVLACSDEQDRWCRVPSSVGDRRTLLACQLEELADALYESVRQMRYPAMEGDGDKMAAIASAVDGLYMEWERWRDLAMEGAS